MTSPTNHGAAITKVLFVCSRNKARSLTAERIYEKFDRYQVRSRGTEDNARIRVTAGDIGWADVIFVMEKRHAERLRQRYERALAAKPVICLHIPDIYEPMEETLVEELKAKLEAHLDIPD